MVFLVLKSEEQFPQIFLKSLEALLLEIKWIQDCCVLFYFSAETDFAITYSYARAFD